MGYAEQENETPRLLAKLAAAEKDRSAFAAEMQKYRDA